MKFRGVTTFGVLFNPEVKSHKKHQKLLFSNTYNIFNDINKGGCKYFHEYLRENENIFENLLGLTLGTIDS